MKVEVAYALPQKQWLEAIELQEGATIREAIEKSDIRKHLLEKDIKKLVVGIWSKVCNLDRELSDGDRVEIYRPLLIDPKTMRRERAKLKEI